MKFRLISVETSVKKLPFSSASGSFNFPGSVRLRAASGFMSKQRSEVKSTLKNEAFQNPLCNYFPPFGRETMKPLVAMRCLDGLYHHLWQVLSVQTECPPRTITEKWTNESHGGRRWGGGVTSFSSSLWRCCVCFYGDLASCWRTIHHGVTSETL